MATKFSQGLFTPLNPSKYVGDKPPYYRSSWELAFMRMCDNHPNIVRWANENIKIPYQHPFTGRIANYVPDFLVEYIDKKGSRHVELIEIKPSSQTTMEGARSRKDKAAAVLNAAKWQSAYAWCEKHGIRFKVVNEDQIFQTKKKRNPSKRNPAKRK